MDKLFRSISRQRTDIFGRRRQAAKQQELAQIRSQARLDSLRNGVHGAVNTLMPSQRTVAVLGTAALCALFALAVREALDVDVITKLPPVTARRSVRVVDYVPEFAGGESLDVISNGIIGEEFVGVPSVIRSAQAREYEHFDETYIGEDTTVEADPVKMGNATATPRRSEMAGTRATFPQAPRTPRKPTKKEPKREPLPPALPPDPDVPWGMPPDPQKLQRGERAAVDRMRPVL